MANRQLLAANKLEDFKNWLVKDGWRIVPARGYFEVLRAKKPGKTPLIVFRRSDNNSAGQHYTVQDSHVGVVRAYINDRKLEKSSGMKVSRILDGLETLARERQGFVSRSGTEEDDGQYMHDVAVLEAAIRIIRGRSCNAG